MAGKHAKILVVLVVASLALVASASATSPDVAAMNLQAADVPGATIVAQRTVKEPGFVAAHVRSFFFAKPKVGSLLIAIQSETELGTTSATAATAVSNVQKAFKSKAGRTAVAKALAKQSGLKATAVTVGLPKAVTGFDQGVAEPITILVKGGRLYTALVYLRLDRVLARVVFSALRPIGAGTVAGYATVIASHIGTELAPASVTPPTVSGTAQQGQTLTATPGTWTAPGATLTYQWQRCDAAGLNCADIPGATAQTYAVTAADVGATLHVVVTATTRFGFATASSTQTAVVT